MRENWPDTQETLKIVMSCQSLSRDEMYVLLAWLARREGQLVTVKSLAEWSRLSEKAVKRALESMGMKNFDVE